MMGYIVVFVCKEWIIIHKEEMAMSCYLHCGWVAFTECTKRIP